MKTLSGSHGEAPRRATPFRAWHAAAFLGGVTALSALATSRDAQAQLRRVNPLPHTPPAWVVPSVWGAVNVLQLWADLRVLNRREAPDRNTILGLRAVNWLLYALFTPSFFRNRRPKAGEAAALAEGVTSGAAIAILARRDPLAAAALAPLTLWTAYLSLLRGEAAAHADTLVDRLRWGGAF